MISKKNPNLHDASKKIVQMLLTKTSSFDDEITMLEHGYSCLTRLLKSQDEDFMHTFYMYADVDLFQGKTVEKIYVGESSDFKIRFQSHFSGIIGTAWPDKHDKIIAESLKNGQFHYTHIQIPSCTQRKITLIEQCIVFCCALFYGDAAMANSSLTVPRKKKKVFNLVNDDIIAIGSIMLANLLEVPMLMVDTREKTYRVAKAKFKCPMCELYFTKIYDVRIHLTDGQGMKNKLELESKLLKVPKLKCENASLGCAVQFLDQSKRQNHIDHYCGFGSDGVVCPNQHCKKRMHKEQLQTHLTSCNKTKPLNCKNFPKCTRKFKNAETLRKHMTRSCHVQKEKHKTGKKLHAHTKIVAKCLMTIRSENMH